MKAYIEERAVEIANYIIKYNGCKVASVKILEDPSKLVERGCIFR